MLPTLTAAARRRPPRRGLLGAAGALFLLLALLSAVRGAAPAPDVTPRTLAEALAPSSWAIAVPVSWFAAPIVGLRPGDHVDVLALRPGERPVATAVAFDLIVVSADERAVVFGTGADDATALGVARAAGQLLIPLLRSTR